MLCCVRLKNGSGGIFIKALPRHPREHAQVHGKQLWRPAVIPNMPYERRKGGAARLRRKPGEPVPLVRKVVRDVLDKLRLEVRLEPAAVLSLHSVLQQGKLANVCPPHL